MTSFKINTSENNLDKVIRQFFNAIFNCRATPNVGADKMKLVGLRTEGNCYYGNHYDFYLCEIASNTVVYSVVNSIL